MSLWQGQPGVVARTALPALVPGGLTEPGALRFQLPPRARGGSCVTCGARGLSAINGLIPDPDSLADKEFDFH